MPDDRGERIQEEIRKRILEVARKRERQHSHREETKATLDALEEIVDLPREEMDRIAKEVEAEFGCKSGGNDVRKTRRTTRPFYLISAVLGIAAFWLFRHGSSLYLLLGAAAVGSLYLMRRK